MKLNIAFHTLLAVVSTTSRAHARIPHLLRDPRTVEEKDEVRRQTMGDHASSTILGKDAGGMTCGDRLTEAELEFQKDFSLEKAKSLACSAVSSEYSACRGCQGFSKMRGKIHIPGCIEMTSEDCTNLAKAIITEKPNWFKDGLNTDLVSEERNVGLLSEMDYYQLGLPVVSDSVASDGSGVIAGVAGDCMVHYAWDWCFPILTNGETVTACIKLPPWDCSAVGGECLSAKACCTKIQAEYPKPDINDNELQCYEWVLPTKSIDSGGGNTITSGTSDSVGGNVSGGVSGSRLVIHLSNDKVVHPAEITGGIHEVVQDEENKDEENSPIQQTCLKSFPNDLDSNGAPTTLLAAVKAYVDANQDCANGPTNCKVGEEWGYPINSWCVEKVTSFSKLFYFMQTFNEDINGWTTSQVTNMKQVFNYAEAFNQPLNSWDVSNVNDMQSMFNGATTFNQPLNSWEVSQVNYMNHMFRSASAFNQPLNNWNVSRVTIMYLMFNGASIFNQPLNNWDVSQVNNMQEMFSGARAFNQPLNSWDVSSVTTFIATFQDAEAFNQNLCHFGVYYDSGVKYSYMFNRSGCPQNKSWTTPSTNGPWCQTC